jgi:hypothetical protein
MSGMTPFHQLFHGLDMAGHLRSSAFLRKIFYCIFRVNTPPLWGVSKNIPLTMFVGMYPEKKRTFSPTLPKQPYPAVPIGTRSAAGLVDFQPFFPFVSFVSAYRRYDAPL